MAQIVLPVEKILDTIPQVDRFLRRYHLPFVCRCFGDVFLQYTMRQMMIARRMMPPTTPPAIPAALILGVMTGPLVGFVITNEINGEKTFNIQVLIPLF